MLRQKSKFLKVSYFVNLHNILCTVNSDYVLVLEKYYIFTYIYVQCRYVLISIISLNHRYFFKKMFSLLILLFLHGHTFERAPIFLLSR